MPKKKNIDIELMKKLYFEKKWNYKKIATYFGFKSKSSIYDRFKKHNLKARTNTDLKTGTKHSKETKQKISKSLKKSWKEGKFKNPEYKGLKRNKKGQYI